jgi:small subunit ribosomal protein S16
MAVSIRLRREGTKNVPYFRIVVVDARSPRDGRFIEKLGTYNPEKKGVNFSVNLDRANYWISKGAIPSDTVRSILKKSAKNAAASAVPAPVPAA